MKRVRYKKEDLINIIKEFYISNGKIPKAEDFKSTSPSTSTFYRHFSSWEDVLISSGFTRESKNIDRSKEELILLLKQYYKEFKEVPTAKGLESKENYPSHQPYYTKFGSLKNALIEAGLFDLRKDKHNFDRDKYTRDECLILLENYIEKNNKIPTSYEIKCDITMPSDMRYYSLFGGINGALLELGYKPINIGRYTDTELIDKLKQFYNELKQVPTYKDIEDCKHMPAPRVYLDRFGSIYTAYDLAEIPYDFSIKQIDNEVIIDMWLDLKKQLDRIPTIRDIENAKFDFSRAIVYRWGSYAEFLESMGEEKNYNKYNCRTYLSEKRRIVCTSYDEYVITNYLENLGVEFSKEVMYKNVLKNDKTMRRFDWVIEKGNDTFYVEYFGMTNVYDYYTKAQKKINDCKENDIKLIEIYPSDVKEKSLEEIFYFLNN